MNGAQSGKGKESGPVRRFKGKQLGKRSGLRRHASEVLSDLLRRKDLDREFRLRWAQTVWSRVCGPEVAKRTWPEKIEGNRLTVGVSDSVWLQELSLKKNEFLEALARAMPDGVKPTEIRFKLRTGRP